MSNALDDAALADGSDSDTKSASSESNLHLNGQGTSCNDNPNSRASQGGGYVASPSVPGKANQPPSSSRSAFALTLLTSAVGGLVPAVFVYYVHPRPSCVPGETQPCSYDLQQGYRRCSEDGRAWRGCEVPVRVMVAVAQEASSTRVTDGMRVVGEVPKATREDIDTRLLSVIRAYAASLSRLTSEPHDLTRHLHQDYQTSRATLDSESGFVRRDLFDATGFLGNNERLSHRYDRVSVTLGDRHYERLSEDAVRQSFRQHFRGIVNDEVIYEDCGTKVVIWNRRGMEWLAKSDYQIDVAACGTRVDDPT